MDALELPDEQEHENLYNFASISQIVQLLHQKKGKIGCLQTEEEKKEFLTTCDQVVDIIKKWSQADQDLFTFLRGMVYTLSIAKAFGSREMVSMSRWRNSFCINEVGWHLRSKPKHTTPPSTASGSHHLKKTYSVVYTVAPFCISV